MEIMETISNVHVQIKYYMKMKSCQYNRYPYNHTDFGIHKIQIPGVPQNTDIFRVVVNMTKILLQHHKTEHIRLGELIII